MSQPQENEVAWAKFELVSKQSGWTVNALRELKKKGKIREGYLWVKREGRLLMHIERFNKWIETGIQE